MNIKIRFFNDMFRLQKVSSTATITPIGNPKLIKCPRGHLPTTSDTGSSYRCDVCQTSGLRGSRLCCKSGGCDFDVCASCAAGPAKSEVSRPEPVCIPNR